jgi:hypothetical protein
MRNLFVWFVPFVVNFRIRNCCTSSAQRQTIRVGSLGFGLFNGFLDSFGIREANRRLTLSRLFDDLLQFRLSRRSVKARRTKRRNGKFKLRRTDGNIAGQVKIHPTVREERNIMLFFYVDADKSAARSKLELAISSRLSLFFFAPICKIFRAHLPFYSLLVSW